MKSLLHQQLEKLDSRGICSLFMKAQHGIEKEGLRVDKSGQLSKAPHPEGLGSALSNPTITTDYSESLLELITPVFERGDKAIDYLENLHRFTYKHLKEELIWAGSMPCRIEDPSTIPIARFGTSNEGRFKHIYRIGLKHRYGKMMQTIAGIHYNFSLPNQFWEVLQEQQQNRESLKDFRSASYFTLIRNFRRHSWLLLYLFGASPALSDTFLTGKPHRLERLHDRTLYLPHATSLRMSDLGYSTKAQSSLDVCFNQLETYIRSLEQAIRTPYPAYEKIGVKVDGKYRQLSDTILQIENEYYSDIRPKSVPKDGETALQALKARGVEYIEVRLTDINPFLPAGLNYQQAIFMDIFLISCLLMQGDILCPNECKQVAGNLQKVISSGRKPGLMLREFEEERSLQDMGSGLLQQLGECAEFLDQLHGTDVHTLAVEAQREKLEDVSLTPSARVLQALEESGANHTEWILQQSKEHRDYFTGTPLPRDQEVSFEQNVERSRVEQQRLEENTAMDFESFLATKRPMEHL